MRKLLIISMLVIGALGFSYRRKRKPSPPPVNTSKGCTNYRTTTLCIPRRKDVNARKSGIWRF